MNKKYFFNCKVYKFQNTKTFRKLENSRIVFVVVS